MTKTRRKRRQQNKIKNSKLRNISIFGKSIENPMNKFVEKIVSETKNLVPQ